jgi:hypothetical protein
MSSRRSPSPSSDQPSENPNAHKSIAHDDANDPIILDTPKLVYQTQRRPTISSQARSEQIHRTASLIRDVVAGRTKRDKRGNPQPFHLYGEVINMEDPDEVLVAATLGSFHPDMPGYLPIPMTWTHGKPDA